MQESGKWVKIKVGDEYSCIFRGLRFDETGGYQGKPTVKYELESLEDGEIREFSSSSKVLAAEMRKLVDGDRITIVGKLGKGDKKTYEVIIDRKAKKRVDDEDEETDEDEEEEETPRRRKSHLGPEYDDIPVHKEKDEEEEDGEDEDGDEDDEDEEEEEEETPKKKKKKSKRTPF